MTGPIGFVVGTILVLVVIGVNMISKRTVSTLLKVVFVISMLTYVAPVLGFATTSHEQYVRLFNDFSAKYYGGVTYQGVIDLAAKNGWSQGYSIVNTLYAMPVMFLGYFGFTFLASAGGEVKTGGQEYCVRDPYRGFYGAHHFPMLMVHDDKRRRLRVHGSGLILG